MHQSYTKIIQLIIALWVLLHTLTQPTFAASTSTLTVDNFTQANANNLGLARQYLDDTMAGGKTQFNPRVEQQRLKLSGDIVPPRGQPGWASAVLPLANLGTAFDASQYTGIKLRVKINSGQFSVSANSLDVTNFDYHAAPVAVAYDGEFHDVVIPFESLKRAWSAQTTLNTRSLNSISIVAYGLQPTTFEAEIAQVSFY